MWPVSIHAAQAADGPRLAEARGCLEHDLALEEVEPRTSLIDPP